MWKHTQFICWLNYLQNLDCAVFVLYNRWLWIWRMVILELMFDYLWERFDVAFQGVHFTWPRWFILPRTTKRNDELWCRPLSRYARINLTSCHTTLLVEQNCDICYHHWATVMNRQYCSCNVTTRRARSAVKPRQYEHRHWHTNTYSDNDDTGRKNGTDVTMSPNVRGLVWFI